MAAKKKKQQKRDNEAVKVGGGGDRDSVVSAVVAAAKKQVDDFDLSYVGPPQRYFDSGSYALNWAMSGMAKSGGFPGGRVVEIYGDPSTGKSLLIYTLMAHVTQNDGYAVLDDVEDCYMEPYGAKLGVDNSRVIPMDSDTVETHIERVIALRAELRKKVGPKPPVLIALDCLAALSTRHELETDLDTRDMTKASAIKKAMRVLRIELRGDHNTLYVVSNHTIANIGNMYKKKTTPGGGGVPFQASIRVELGTPKDLVEEGTKRTLGVDSFARVTKNKIVEPRRSCRLRIMFKQGLVRDWGLFETAKAGGVCVPVSANGWYTMEGHDSKFQESGFWKDNVWEKAVELLDRR